MMMDVLSKVNLRSAAKNLWLSVLGLLFIGGFVLINICSIPIFIFRVIVILAAKAFRPDLGEILEPFSSLFANDLFSKRTPRGSLVSPLTLRGHLRVEDIQSLVVKNWINLTENGGSGQRKYQQLQQYPFRWLGFTFWKNDPDFNISNHLFCHPNLGNPTVSDKELDRFTEKLFNAPYPPGQSPWEIHIVQNYENPSVCKDQMSVLLFKFHHSFADGFSLLAAVSEGIFLKPLDFAQLAKPRDTRKRTTWQKLAYIGNVFHAMIFDNFWIITNTFEDSPWKIPDKRKAWHQIYGKSKLIPIHKIKHIKNSLGVSFTSVMISAISAGIQDNLANNNKSPSETEVEDRDFMPCFSVLPALGRRSGTFTNQLTGAVFDIPINKCEKPETRIRLCHRKLESSKESLIPFFIKFIVNLVGWQTAANCNLAILQNQMIPTGLTNFPAFPQPVFIGKNEVLTIDFASGGQEGVCGVAFMVLSYNKHIRVVVVAERAVLTRSEVADLIKRMEKEIDDLYSHVNFLQQ